MVLAQQLWSQIDDWWDMDVARAVAAEVAGLSLEARGTVAELFTEFASEATAVIFDQPSTRVSLQRPQPLQYRRGAEPLQVHTRPAEAYRRTFAFNAADEAQAYEAAIERAARLIEDDAMLAALQAQQQTYDALRVEEYRRVLRPELSVDGPCGLCVVASNRVYTRRDLMPIHNRDSA